MALLIFIPVLLVAIGLVGGVFWLIQLVVYFYNETDEIKPEDMP